MLFCIIQEGGIYNFQWQNEIFARLHLTHLGRSFKVKLTFDPRKGQTSVDRPFGPKLTQKLLTLNDLPKYVKHRTTILSICH